MRIDITKGVGTLTTESKKELTLLMQIYTQFQEKGDKMFDAQERVVYRTTDAKLQKETQEVKKRATHTRTCHVDGCDAKVKGLNGLQVHMGRHHGIRPNGEQMTFWKFKGVNKPIPCPVMRKGNGWALIGETAKTGWMTPTELRKKALLPEVEEVKQITSNKQPISL